MLRGPFMQLAKHDPCLHRRRTRPDIDFPDLSHPIQRKHDRRPGSKRNRTTRQTGVPALGRNHYAVVATRRNHRCHLVRRRRPHDCQCLTRVIAKRIRQISLGISALRKNMLCADMTGDRIQNGEALSIDSTTQSSAELLQVLIGNPSTLRLRWEGPTHRRLTESLERFNPLPAGSAHTSGADCRTPAHAGAALRSHRKCRS